jgi:hypothetical protein
MRWANFNRPDGARVSRRLLQAVNDLPKIKCHAVANAFRLGEAPEFRQVVHGLLCERNKNCVA